MLCKLNASMKAHMNPALKASSVIWYFKRGDVIEMQEGIIFDF